jgi:hypothetical protein
MAHTDANKPLPPLDPFRGPGLAPAHYAGPAEEHPERHEHTDVPVRPLKLFFIWTLILGVLVHVGLYALFNLYDAAEQDRDKQRVRSALTRTREEKLPPEPRVQGIPSVHANTPREDADEMRRQNDTALSAYGKTDNGMVRVPIDRAMDLALQAGFKKSETASSKPTTHPAASNQR